MSGYVKQACSQCGIIFKSYWLRNALCNGCRHPHLIVKAVKGTARTTLEIREGESFPGLLDSSCERTITGTTIPAHAN